ncbi:MAG: phosphoribosylamine--glycine ligase N-terminal domain-containing protein, partial [Terrisporobacter sp.]
MRILVVGGGGREHAICWKLNNESNVEKIYCAPGNAGISNVAECIDIGDSDIENLLKFAKENQIDLTIVGPEIPLVAGIVD